ncbi:FlgO family outer membrane protein [Rheinheimera tilapiae]|jgi:TolB-like protein|uniref:FlgO family outer membrane protein n=1 Tax=Rheinheimera tilapiae TaxID=875043 RepID=A0ABV6BJL2_9GAMM
MRHSCLILLALSASLAACQQQPDRQESAAMVQEVAVGPILMYTERLAGRLFAGVQPLPKGALAVVSFTELRSLTPDPYNLSQNLLGLQLQESMIAVASQRGYQVKELRAGQAVEVFSDHERLLTRDLTDLATQQAVRYIIVGTLNQAEQYTTVNARMVDIQTNTVVAAASDLIPAEVLGATEQVQLRQQKLYRQSDN